VAKLDISKPTQRMLTYGGEYDGQLSSFNKKNRSRKDISPYPESNIGAPSVPKNTVFNGRTIVFASKECMLPRRLLHVTEDQGSFIISPDLSRNDPKLQEKRADQ
jgi:hypothetical protein